MSLTKDQVLSADDLPRERVDLPEWAPVGTDPKEAYVIVGTMRGDDKDRFEQQWLTKQKGLIGVRAALAAMTVQDDAGTLLFTADDIAALGQKSAAPLSRIFNAACRLNAILKEDVEDLEKNSPPTGADNSTSSSPVTSAAPSANCSDESTPAS